VKTTKWKLLNRIISDREKKRVKAKIISIQKMEKVVKLEIWEV